MSSVKREGSASDMPSGKKVKTEPASGMIKVELQYFSDADDDDDYDDDENEDKKEFIDVDDEEGSLRFGFENFGWSSDYPDSLRNGHARISSDGKKIGTVSYCLINRDGLGHGLSFWELCDSESGELEQIAAKFFQADGSLKPTLLRRLSSHSKLAMSNMGSFLYIKSLNLDAPYNRTESVDNATIVGKAIEKLVFASAFYNDNVTTTLAM